MNWNSDEHQHAERKMQLQIRSTEPGSAAIETQISERVKELEEYINNLPGCTKCLRHLRFLVIAKAGRVRVHLDVPGSEFTIDKQHASDLPRAIDEAFAATRAELEGYVHKLRHDAKIQGTSPDVRVSTIFHDRYGVLETLDGREVNFPRDPVSAPSLNS
jgi:ribosome-associated translation inhibitor RaiA